MGPNAHLQTGDLLQKRYRIGHLLGEGGFGEVYEAHDVHMDRKVALKFVYRRLDTEFLRAEVAVLARNAERLKFIPNVYDHWEQKLHPAGYYIVMEFVEGETLDKIRKIPWSADAVTSFLRILLRNLHDLHSREIIHCDIKPVNIKEIPPNGLSYYVPFMILDFGIAKQGNITTLRGTSEYYAAPEQYGKGATDIKIGPRTDLYGLAATAYYLLTGRTPLDAATRYTNAVELGLGDTLPPPSSFVADIPPALEHTILDMLRLDRQQRPADAEAALQLLEQRLKEPGPVTEERSRLVQPPTELVEAPPTPAPVAALPLLTELPHERRIFSVPRPNKAPPTPDESVGDDLVLEQVARHSNGTITSLAWSPKGGQLLIGSTLGIFACQLDSPNQPVLYYASEQPVRRVSYTLDGAAIVALSGARTMILSAECEQILGELAGPAPYEPGELLVASLERTIAVVADRDLTLFSADTGVERGTWQLPEQLSERCVAMSADGRTLAVCAEGRLHCWTVQTDLRGQQWSSSNIPRPHIGLALATNGMVAAAAPHSVVVWNRESQTTVAFDHPNESVHHIACSGDGRTILLATNSSVILQRTRDGKILHSLAHPQPASIHSLVFSADDQFIAAASDETVTVWRVRDGVPAATIAGFGGPVQSMAALPEGRIVVARAKSISMHTYDSAGFTGVTSVESLPDPALALAASTSGETYAAATTTSVQLWGIGAQPQVWPVKASQMHSLCFGVDSDGLLVIGNTTLIAIDPTRNALETIPLAETDWPDYVALSAGGNKIAAAYAGRISIQSLQPDDTYSFQPFAQEEICALALSPDGTRLVVATQTMLACWWIGEDDPQLIARQPLARHSNIHHILFSPDGNLVVALHHNIADVWQIADEVLRHVGSAQGHTDRINDAAISADGAVLLTGSRDGTLRLWRLQEGLL